MYSFKVLDLGTRCWLVVSFTRRPPYPPPAPGMGSQYLVDKINAYDVVHTDPLHYEDRRQPNLCVSNNCWFDVLTAVDRKSSNLWDKT
jgi:hypothetical protein